MLGWFEGTVVLEPFAKTKTPKLKTAAIVINIIHFLIFSPPSVDFALNISYED
jgi:hypothetical protein